MQSNSYPYNDIMLSYNLALKLGNQRLQHTMVKCFVGEDDVDDQPNIIKKVRLRLHAKLCIYFKYGHISPLVLQLIDHMASTNTLL